LDTLESQIYQSIAQEEQDIDTLSEVLQLSPSELTIKLSLLELKKLVKKNLSGKYTLV